MTKKSSFHILWMLALVVLMFAVLTACGAKKTEAPEPETPVTVVEPNPEAVEPGPAEAAEPAPAETPAPAPAEAAEPAPAEAAAVDLTEQLQTLSASLQTVKQDEAAKRWFYAVTDLDHNGWLEIVAAAQHSADRSNNLKIWEVSPNGELAPCRVALAEGESFPDILTDNTDTYHVTDTDTWSYICYDNIVLTDEDSYVVKCSVSFKDGVMSYTPYAIQHTEGTGDSRTVSYTDANGFVITPEKYNSSGVDAFPNAERSNTNFDWFVFNDASLDRLSESYEVFAGLREPTEVFPVPKPTALAQGSMVAVTPAPTATPASINLSVTKNPTNENRRTGETAILVSSASAYDSLTWTFVSPNGGEYSVSSFRSNFPYASVSGESSTTLSVSNVQTDMDGWGAYCTFYYKGQTARTSTAYIYVQGDTTEKYVPGTLQDYAHGEYTIGYGGGAHVTLPASKVNMIGEPFIGADVDLWYTGSAPDVNTVTTVNIYGDRSDPVYGSMAGYAYEAGGGYSIDLDNGANVYVDAWLCQVVSGYYEDGCSCTVYYTDSPTEENIYDVDIYGIEKPDPVFGSMAGYAYAAGGGYSIDLANGDNVYVDAASCHLMYGVFEDGCSCTAYYTDYPSAENIYGVDIYGVEDEPFVGPITGNMDGKAHEAGGGYSIDLDNGDNIYADAIITDLYGSFYDGAPCTVYYYNYPSTDNLYNVEIYGNYDEPDSQNDEFYVNYGETDWDDLEFDDIDY